MRSTETVDAPRSVHSSFLSQALRVPAPSTARNMHPLRFQPGQAGL